ncbi:alpha/beta fold hydrolase [Dietzia psychralcaliphila]|uniref:alpha/beta fold hydrolase n=1 Tax=Dietzia psychralcaliphila TaxID=139021 RepID=UPI001C1E1887|nr:alpha/beta hydrolase [Dietzia psychralcaliphila]
MSRAIVLVHGGQHTSECWKPTVEALAVLRPDIEVIAVDLPGRAGNPADIRTVGIADCVASVVADVERAGVDDVMLVAHSMGGVTVPGVAAVLGADRVSRMVFVAAAMPPDGMSILQDLVGDFQAEVTGKVQDEAEPAPFPREMAEQLFCNGMTDEQTEFSVSGLCAESDLLATQAVDRSGMPERIPRTWILTGQDRAVTPEQQRAHIKNLGGVENVVEIDTCHDVMISEPDILAKVLVEHF